MIGNLLLHALKRKKPGHLILHVTDRCQLKCRTCFNKDVQGTDLDLGDIKRVSDFIPNPLMVDIAGGEPFLRDDLPEICTLFNANLISIATNGQDSSGIFDTVKEIRKRLDKSIHFSISISLDGFRETNDAIRGKGSYDKTIETIGLLSEIPEIRRKVNTVLCRDNAGEIIEFMAFVKTLEMDFHTINLMRGDPRDAALGMPSIGEIRKLKGGIYRMWKGYEYGEKNPLKKRVLHNYQRRAFETGLKVMEEREQIPACLAGTKHLVVWSNGDVAFCEMLGSIGNIHAAELSEILSSQKAALQRGGIKEGRCFCHHDCNMLDNHFMNIRRYPGLLFGEGGGPGK